MDRLLSGRYLFTVICALMFAYLCISGGMDKNDSMQLIMLVATFYFLKDNNTPKGA